MKGYLFILTICALILLSACGTGGNKEKENDGNVPEDAAELSDGALLTLENDGIDDTELAELMDEFPEVGAERVITTSVPLTEMLHYFGVTPVGVPTSTNPIPEEFQQIEQIGSPMAPNLEIITDLEADLILSATSLQSTLENQLADMDELTAYLPTDSLSDLKVSFKALGTYFDKTELLNTKMQSILDKENELKEKFKNDEMPTVMLLVGTADSFMVMNEKSYLGSLVDRIGADNIATSVFKAKDTYSPVNMEQVVATDPDMIFVLASGDHGAAKDMFKKTVESNATWKKLSAYENDEIHVLDNDLFGVTSIINVEEALTDLGNILMK